MGDVSAVLISIPNKYKNGCACICVCMLSPYNLKNAWRAAKNLGTHVTY